MHGPPNARFDSRTVRRDAGPARTVRSATLWKGIATHAPLRTHYVTSRFTQPDPIGLAGGLNLYGFAGGDPVNFSDPFGLCPACVGAALGVLEGFAVARLTGSDYTWKDAAVDATLGAVGAGLVDKLNDLRKADKGRVVVGETMSRVRAAAREFGAETFETTATTSKQIWRENSSWLRKAMREGKEIIDIGQDASRAKRSPFYQAEKALIEAGGYPTTKVAP
jgi:hypothetical protein